MTARPTDWTPLAGSDPVPGDPDTVERIGRQYVATADELRQQAARLRALSTDRSWDSDAADEWRHQGHEVAGKLGKVVDRYDATGRALRTYSAALRGAQDLADRARALAQDADRRSRTAQQGKQDQLHQHASQPAGTPPPDTSAFDRQAAQASEDLATARTWLHDATQERDDSAARAASAIDDITGSDGLDDGHFAGFRKWVGDRVEWVDRNLKKITDIAGWVATICGTAALLVGWIPVVGQIAAAVLTGIATLASVVALIGSFVLALEGRGSWLDVGINALGLLTFGVGRAAVTGVKAGARATRAAAQSGRTEELVAAAVRSRGGQVGGKTLRRITTEARRVAKAQPGGGLTRDGVTEALAAAPGRLPGRLAAAFNPVTVARETAQGTRDLFRKATWVDTLSAVRARQVADPVIDAAARQELAQAARLTAPVRSMPGVADQLAATAYQKAYAYGSTVIGSGTDWADKLHVFDPVKPRSTGPVR